MLLWSTACVTKHCKEELANIRDNFISYKKAKFCGGWKRGLRFSFGFSELEVFQSCLLKSFWYEKKASVFVRFPSQLNTLNAIDRQFKSNLRFIFPTWWNS